MARPQKPKVYPLLVNPQNQAKHQAEQSHTFHTQPLLFQATLIINMNVLVECCLLNYGSAIFKKQNFKMGSVSIFLGNILQAKRSIYIKIGIAHIYYYRKHFLKYFHIMKQTLRLRRFSVKGV